MLVVYFVFHSRFIRVTRLVCNRGESGQLIVGNRANSDVDTSESFRNRVKSLADAIAS